MLSVGTKSHGFRLCGDLDAALKGKRECVGNETEGADEPHIRCVSMQNLVGEV